MGTGPQTRDASAPGPVPTEARAHLALIEEACKKAGLIWLALPGAPAPHPAWHAWVQGAAYVVCGGLEQPLPGLASALESPADQHAGGALVPVTVPSKDKGGRLVTWLARATLVAPGTPAWELAAPELAAGRLNAPDGPGQVQRWARECRVVRLEPTGELLESPGAMPTDSGAAAPVPTAATTRGPLPFVLGRRRAAGPR